MSVLLACMLSNTPEYQAPVVYTGRSGIYRARAPTKGHLILEICNSRACISIGKDRGARTHSTRHQVNKHMANVESGI